MARPPIINLRTDDFKDIEQPSFKKLISTINQFGKEVNNSLNSKLTVSDNLNGFYTTVKFVVKKSIAFIPPAHYHVGVDFQYNANFGPKAGYAELTAFTNAGLVTIGGVVVASAGNQQIITTLPKGVRPEYKVKWETGNSPIVEIDTDGRIIVTNAGGGVYTGDITFGRSYAGSTDFLATYPFSQTLTQAFPFRIKNELLNKTKPSAILVANSHEIVNQGREEAGLSGVSFKPVGEEIEIEYIGGVHNGDAYEVTLLVLGE